MPNYDVVVIGAENQGLRELSPWLKTGSRSCFGRKIICPAGVPPASSGGGSRFPSTT